MKNLVLPILLTLSLLALTSYGNTPRRDRNYAKKRGFHNAGDSTRSRMRSEFSDSSVCEDFKVRVGGFGISEKSIFFFDDAIAENRSSIENLSLECLSNFVDEYVEFKEEREASSPQSACTQGGCPYFDAMYAHYQQNLAFIRNLVEQKTVPEDPRECLAVTQTETEPAEDQTEIETISTLQERIAASGLLSQEENVLDESPDNPWCSEFEIGQSKIVDKSAYGSPTSVEMKYALTRDSENQYSADLVIDFNKVGNSQYNDAQIL